MKNITMSITPLLILLLLVTQLYSPASLANNIATNICEYVAADNKKRLRSFLKTQHIKLRSIFGDVTCNGKNLLLFAAARNSEKVGKMIIKKLPKKTLRLFIDELSSLSASLGEIAKERAG
ncbi:MAG: DUF3718 domain-containing protein [Colwellia sp.]|nr:DUF3718 domain-containing protein [Colwellia sp.]